MRGWALVFFMIQPLFFWEGARAEGLVQCKNIFRAKTLLSSTLVSVKRPLNQEKEFILAKSAVEEALKKQNLLKRIASNNYVQNSFFVMSLIQSISSPFPFIYLPEYNLKLSENEAHFVLEKGIDSEEARHLIDRKTPLIKKLNLYNKARKVYLTVMIGALSFYTVNNLWNRWEQADDNAKQNGAIVLQQITEAVKKAPDVKALSYQDIHYQQTINLYIERKGHPPSEEELQFIYKKIYAD